MLRQFVSYAQEVLFNSTYYFFKLIISFNTVISLHEYYPNRRKCKATHQQYGSG